MVLHIFKDVFCGFSKEISIFAATFPHKSVGNKALFPHKNVQTQILFPHKSVVNMKRFIYNHLKDWKLSSNRKPLIMYGARQVGKTYIIKEFGNNEFENMVYINCYKNKSIAQLFKVTQMQKDFPSALLLMHTKTSLLARPLYFSMRYKRFHQFCPR